jgi:hypothetical protein
MNPLDGNYAATPNPFFTVANQFLPRNLHDVIRWARFITIQSPMTTEVVRKLSTYPITDFIVDTVDPKVKARYEEIFKKTRLKSALHDIGFEYYTIGNVFLSIYFPIQRMLQCPSCSQEYNAKTSTFITFRHYEFHGICPKCAFSGNFIRKDTKSMDIRDLNLVKWDPVNIAVNHNPITNEYEYYYKIPNEVRRRVRQGDKLFVNSVPWGFIEAVKNNQDFKFDRDNIYHLRNMSAGPLIEGVAIPPLICLFSLVFYQQTLRRGNEAIAQDYMTPLRVVFPQAQTGNSDPVISISMRNFAARMKQAFIEHKRDPNHVLIAPVPVGYQAISGEGKTLLVAQEIAQADEAILLSLGVSKELLSGQTNWTSSTVGLRLLRNTLEVYVDQIEGFIEWFVTRVSKYLTIETCNVELAPFKLADDEGLRQMLGQLVMNGTGSFSSLYESYGMDFDEELRKIKEDAVSSAVNKVETQIEIEQAEFLAAREVGEKVDKEGDYHNALEKAQAIAEELYNADEASRRQVLNQFKLDDYAMYLMVSKLLQEEQEKKSADLAMQQAGLAEGQPGQPGQPGDGSAEDSDAKGPGGSQPPSGESSAPQGPPQADQTPSQKAA